MECCIYCQKDKKETIFSRKGQKGEHVIPQFLGSFNLYFGNHVVCRTCNNQMGESEKIFKEGSIAGLHSAIYSIDSARSSMWIQKKD